MKIHLAPPQLIHELGKRSNQEDAYAAADSLFVLCDGMGGHQRGEVASRIVADTFVGCLADKVSNHAVLSDYDIGDAMQQTYRQIDTLDHGSTHRPGTTLTMLAFHRQGATAAYIGDSRIYHIRPSENRMLYISADHSYVFDLFRIGEIGYDEIATHPRRNIITRAVMPGEEYREEPDIVHISDIRAGDYFYLCSDGMLEQMTDAELLQLLASNATDDDKRQQLIDATADNSDNHTAWLLRVEQVEQEAADRNLADEEATTHSNALWWQANPPQRIADEQQQPPMPAELPPTAPTTPHPQQKWQWKSYWWILMAIVIIVAALLLIGNNGEKKDKEPNQTTISTQSKKTHRKHPYKPAPKEGQIKNRPKPHR